MESYNNQEESINSSEERVDDHPSDQEKNDAGVGRSYECVFCKRGFNTAQALGGHMNIHRKDRARNKPTSRDHKHEENHYLGPRFYQQMIVPDHLSENNYINDHHHYNLSYATYFPESSTNTRSHFQQKQPENPLIMNEDWRLSLSLDFTPKIIEDLEKISEEEELDLELRLGYDS